LPFTALYSQTFKQFSGEIKTFPDEVVEFINTINASVLDDTYYDFAASWDSAVFKDNEKKKIIAFSKCFIDKKVRPFPEYYNFLKTLNLFISYEHPKESFNLWLSALVDICSNKKISLAAVNRLIDNTYRIMYDEVLYQSPSISWKLQEQIYSFSYDTELRVIFDETDLICYAKRDSIKVFKTKGELALLNMQWYGQDGLVTWERAGYQTNNVNAKLHKYKIDLSKSSYEADSVEFTNTTYFNKPLLGKLEDNVTLIKNPELASFPKFESYVKKFKINNLYLNVNYEGGFSMQGAKLVGKGSAEEPATLDFFRKDTLKLKAQSLFFTFRPEKVVGVDVAVTIYLDKDSIHHGDLQFSYKTQNKEISLLKSENYTAQSPYLNSYHKVDMSFEQLLWRIDEPNILLTTTPGSTIGKALFESLNYFNFNEFSGLQYYDEIHPLVALRNYSKKLGITKFYIQDFAAYMRRTSQDMNSVLFPLAIKGYIFFDSSTGEIELKKRLFDNLASSIGKIDYDVVRINSVTNAPLENANIDLRNNDIKIFGIPRIAVSDSQNVIIYPKNETILLKRNRNFQFDGVIEAGLLTYYGRNFFFNYEEFKIGLKDVDSIHIKVITGFDNFNKPIYQNVQNTLEDVTGDILIDNPENKSGIKSYPEYPIFTSVGSSYVYYDDPRIFKGVYKRNRDFYFEIDPYRLDSLDNFQKAGMEFKGRFSSANIFPVIPEKLSLMEDYSLGFFHQSPAEGFPLYVDKGTFNNTVNLSNRGLKGNGVIKYLTSTTNSEEFFFFPDSMNTLAPDFTIEPRTTATEYPNTKGQNVWVHWVPYKDNMQLRNKEKAFSMFNTETTMSGLLTLKPTGLTGAGLTDMTTAYSRSEMFKYGNQTIDADTMNFYLRSLHTDGLAVKTNNVNAHIDFSKRSGLFKSNSDTSITEFPENKYIAQLDEFKWKIDLKQFDMISKRTQPASTAGQKFGFKDEPMLGSRYTSVKFDQDSLSFVSPLAVYDYDKIILNAQKVKYIEVADARIFPKDENVLIEAGAKMQPFINAKILANTESRFHNIYKAEATIYSRKDYKGRGLYDYVDETNKIQTFNFSKIEVDSTLKTVAEGDVVEPDDFTLSPNFQYQGKIILNSPEKLLTFRGATHIKEACPNYGTSWFSFDSPIDPINIAIPVNAKLNEINRKFIELGSLITTDSIHVYSSFFGERKNHSDSVITTSRGVLRYIKDSSTYNVADPLKIKDPSLSLPMVSLNTKTCMHRNEGLVNLGVHYGQMKINCVGNSVHDLAKNKLSMRVMMSLDFLMHEGSMTSMARAIDSLSGNKTPADIKSPYFRHNLSYLIDTGRLNKFYNELKVDGKVKDLPQELSSKIFLTDVKLVWDDESNSYRSVGKIGIGYVFKRSLNIYVDGYIEVWRKRSGDVFDLYLKIDDKTFYYFGYTRGTFQVLSSDQKYFNDPIRNLSDNDRTVKVSRGQTPFTFLVSGERKKNLVVNRWLNRDNKSTNQDQPEEQGSDLEFEKVPADKAKNDSLKTPDKPIIEGDK
jgi:hypothetical protein